MRQIWTQWEILTADGASPMLASTLNFEARQMVSIADVLTAEYFDRGRRACWAPYLLREFSRPYMGDLRDYLHGQSACDVFPKPEAIFAALDETTLEELKVVILGQDPYHGLGQAHGLAFSTLAHRRPPSLRNIFAEVESNMNGDAVPEGHNCLTPWARQGVLLLNRVLTVRRGRAHSHKRQGWERFTDKIVETISENCGHVVFMLWGKKAQRVCGLIDANRHKVLCWQHPAGTTKGQPRGLKGSKHFFQANEYLAAHGAALINWLDVCQRPPPHVQDVVAPLTTADANDEARWDRAFANSTTKLEQLAAEAERERNAGLTEELDPSQL